MMSRDPLPLHEAGWMPPAAGCARHWPGATACRWKCGNACDRPALNPTAGEPFERVLRRFLSRRAFLRGAAAAATALALRPTHTGALGHRPPQVGSAAGRQIPQSGLTFEPVPLHTDDRVLVPPGYRVQPLIRWGDPVLSGAPPFDPLQQTPEAQRLQFGYNNDYIGFFPIAEATGARALLVVNHEYTNPELMFADYQEGAPTPTHVDVEIAAHGVSVVEITRSGGTWTYEPAAPRNRRLTGDTPMLITGPAAGHPWLQTSEDPTGTRVRGTLNNCSGGKTPWGTVLTCEENFNQYFARLADLPDDDPRKAVHRRYGLPQGASERRWELFHRRFDVSQEPNEAFRFGWVVEIDPYDPTFTPRKRTALGRFKHEGAATVLAPTGHVVVYMGDDERFEYVYKFVSAGTVDQANRAANLDLLDHGTLYVARFAEDGTGEWLPLRFGEGPLTPANGFTSQADVLIRTRLAADLLGATKMDRPEDIEPHPVTRRVYLAMTNNTQRTAAQVDRANPRANNRHGHIIELTESGDDPTATRFTWDIFLLCGDPQADDGVFAAGFPVERLSAISSPDNLVFDGLGNLWIFTDGQPSALRKNDAVFAVPVEGPERGFLRPFLSAVPGAETASGDFDNAYETLFVSIQHPGEGSSYAQPSSRFPDGDLPRPSVVAVWKSEGSEKRIGS